MFDHTAYDVVKAELTRIVRGFERRHGALLASWEGTSRSAENLADELSGLLAPPAPRGRSRDDRLPG